MVQLLHSTIRMFSAGEFPDSREQLREAVEYTELPEQCVEDVKEAGYRPCQLSLLLFKAGRASWRHDLLLECEDAPRRPARTMERATIFAKALIDECEFRFQGAAFRASSSGFQVNLEESVDNLQQLNFCRSVCSLLPRSTSMCRCSGSRECRSLCSFSCCLALYRRRCLEDFRSLGETKTKKAKHGNRTSAFEQVIVHKCSTVEEGGDSLHVCLQLARVSICNNSLGLSFTRSPSRPARDPGIARRKHHMACGISYMTTSSASELLSYAAGYHCSITLEA